MLVSVLHINSISKHFLQHVSLYCINGYIHILWYNTLSFLFGSSNKWIRTDFEKSTKIHWGLFFRLNKKIWKINSFTGMIELSQSQYESTFLLLRRDSVLKIHFTSLRYFKLRFYYFNTRHLIKCRQFDRQKTSKLITIRWLYYWHDDKTQSNQYTR